MQEIVDRTRNQLFEQLATRLNEQFSDGGHGHSQYQSNPVGFAEEVLGETLTDDVKLMMRSVRDNQITVAKSGNATGKTHAAARVAVWWYKAFGDCQVYTAAAPPEQNLKKLLWGEIGSVIEGHTELFETDEKKSLHVSKSANSFLTGVSIPASGTAAQREAKFSGKHSPNLLFILDEGDAISDEVYKGIESCMSGGHARLLVMFNPRAEQGEAYRMIRDRRANVVSLSAFNHPNVLTGEDKIPGAVDRQTTVRRINQWTRPLTASETPDTNCFELPGFLVGKMAVDQAGRKYEPLKAGWYKIVEPAFSYMVLGQYPAQGSNQLISREWIDTARSRYDSWLIEHGATPPAYTSAVAGLDVGEFGSDCNALCLRHGNYVEPLVTWQGVDVIATGDRAAVELKTKKVSRCCVDGTGVGSGVTPHMQRLNSPAVSVKVASSPTETSELGEFAILRDQLWWAVREWLRTDQAMLPPDEILLEELLVATYTVDKGRIRVMRKIDMRELLKRSPDRADALCLTFYSSGVFAGADLS